jgi:hypothetical protein
VLRYVLAALSPLLLMPFALARVTSQPDPVHGKDLAEKLCTNCHLVGSAQQRHTLIMLVFSYTFMHSKPRAYSDSPHVVKKLMASNIVCTK